MQQISREEKVYSQLEFPSSYEDEAVALAKVLKISPGRERNISDLGDGSSDVFNYSYGADFPTDYKIAQDRFRSLQTKGKLTVK